MSKKEAPAKEAEVSAAEEIQEDALTAFKKKYHVLPGEKGGGPQNPNTGIWLKDIPEGYMFFTCQRGQTASMFCQVLQHFDKTTVCYDVLNRVKFVVHTSRFSNSHEELQIIPVYPKEEEQAADVNKAEEDGKSDQLPGNEKGPG